MRRDRSLGGELGSSEVHAHADQCPGRLAPALLDRKDLVHDVAALSVLAFKKLANSLSCSEPSIFWVRCTERRSGDAIAIVRGHNFTFHLFIARGWGVEAHAIVRHVDQSSVIGLEG